MTLPPSAAQHRSFAEDLLVGDIATTCDSFGMHHEGGTELSHNASQEQWLWGLDVGSLLGMTPRVVEASDRTRRQADEPNPEQKRPVRAKVEAVVGRSGAKDGEEENTIRVLVKTLTGKTVQV
jgi:hypothetical protein